MDETRHLEMWQQMIEDKDKLPFSWRKGIYKGMLRGVQEAYPETKVIPLEHLMGLAERESTLRKGAISNKGAIGLMQVMPKTADWFAQKKGIFPEGFDLHDPETNMVFGSLYLKYLQDSLGSLEAATQAYHVGPGAYRRGRRSRAYLRDIQKLSGGYK